MATTRQRRKTNDSRWLSGFVALLLVIGALSYLGTSHTRPTKVTSLTTSPVASPSAFAIADPTAGWKTYANPYDIYSIKYPSGWFIEPSLTVGSAVTLSSEDPNNLPGAGDGDPSDPAAYGIDIYPFSNPDKLSLSSFVAKEDQEAIANSGRAPSVTGISNLTVAGAPAYARTATEGYVTEYELYVSRAATIYLIIGRANPSFASTFRNVSQSISFPQG